MPTLAHMPGSDVGGVYENSMDSLMMLNLIYRRYSLDFLGCQGTRVMILGFRGLGFRI